MRLLAIGDIHGCITALNALLEELKPEAEDVVVTLGDYVDRGPDSRAVIDRLLALRRETTLVPLLGNHDRLFLEAVAGSRINLQGWLAVGGHETMESYGSMNAVPEGHLEFLWNDCRLWHAPAGESVFFVHGSARPDLPLESQTEEWLLWRRVHEAGRIHQSGRVMICGHTAQKSGVPLVLPHAVCIDTWVFGDGWLTAFDVHAGEFIQCDEAGNTRRLRLHDLAART